MAKKREESRFFIYDRPIEINAKNLARVIYYCIKATVYKAALLSNSVSLKNSKRNEKRYKVCICAIFKDEGEFLKEWIEYHLIVGIDHFYLYNNNSTDNYYEILKPYITENIVTLVEWPKQHAQIEAYFDAIKKYSDETKWMGFIDLDEYVVPVKHDNVYDFLKQYNYKAASVLIYWKVFGSSGIINRDKDKMVVEQFTWAFPKWDDVGKCFYNTDYKFAQDIEGINRVLHHYCWCKHGDLSIPPVNAQNRIAFPGHNVLTRIELPIQINHYLTKSYDDYYNKVMNKTDVYFEVNPRKMDYFYKIDSCCKKQDFKIFKYITKLKKKMGKTEEN